MKRVISFFIIGCLLPTMTLAQGSESFSIRLFSLVDNTAPSVPVPVTVNPVASTQIDISWGVSTDDYYLNGYVLYRNDTPIATTTQTSFSDVGLTPSTTYSYSVQSYDSAFNYSATSTTVSATTPNSPLPPTPTSTATSSPTSGTSVRTVLRDFNLIEGETTAEFRLQTARPARIEVRWGRSASYELGYTFLEPYVTDFSTTITNLEPGTKYEYEIIGYSPSGIATVLKRGQFRTLSAVASAPSNVLFFSGQANGKDVTLNWVVPTGDVRNVRIVRSHLGFPSEPNNGAIVYQGLGNSFFDQGVLDKYSPVFYTAFVFDSAGNVSSGAVVLVAIDTNGNGVVLPPQASDETPVRIEDDVRVYDENVSTTSDVRDQEEVRIPSKNEILIITKDGEQSFADVKPIIEQNEPFTVVVPADAVSTNLKTILFAIADPQDDTKQYFYILRLNKEGDAYEAVLSPMNSGGWSMSGLSVYDYRTKILANYEKRIWFTGIPRGEQEVWFPDYLYTWAPIVGGGFAVFLILLALVSWRLRRGG